MVNTFPEILSGEGCPRVNFSEENCRAAEKCPGELVRSRIYTVGLLQICHLYFLFRLVVIRFKKNKKG